MYYNDAVASLYGRNSLLDLVARASDDVFVPMTVGGGIRSVEDVRQALLAGADKVAVNTAAIGRPDLINEIAGKFGSQCFVLQLDAKRKGNGWEAYCEGGRQPTGKDAIAWAQEAYERGAGEILVTSIDNEGTGGGFDTELYRMVAGVSDIPIVASGGFGKTEDAVAAVKAGALGIAIAGVLHYGRATIQQIKRELKQAGVPVRI